MAGLKELKTRISSVKATQKITKAMQMVASAKLRRAQDAINAARPYALRIESVLGNLAAGMQGDGNAPALLSGTGNDKIHLLVVASAERGLCGGFNTSIAKIAREHARKLMQEGKDVKILCVGKKAADVLRREFSDVMLDTIELRDAKQIDFSHASLVSSKIFEMFDAGEFDVCTLFYAQFQSVINQIPTAQQLIPADIETQSGDAGANVQYDYEPDEGEILAELLPRNISFQIFKALLENAASEQGARMSAMDNATRNAGEMINSLTLTYNRTRQAIITKELIEIISGAEAL